MFFVDYENFINLLQKYNGNAFLIVFIGLFICFICVMLNIEFIKIFIPYASFIKKEKNWYLKKELNDWAKK